MTDECFEDVLKLLHNPTVIYNRKDIPKTTKGFEKASKLSDMIIKISWQCSQCKAIKSKIMKQGDGSPNLNCCGRKFTYKDDHYIIFNSAQVLQLTLASVQSGFLNNKSDNLSEVFITLNTDGAPLFKGSKSAFWPVLGAVDGTYYKVRKANIIMLGLYVGLTKSSKPDFKILLESIVENLEYYQRTGLEWRDSSNEIRRSLIKLSAVVCDSIARPLVQNIKQFNGKYGCGYCYHNEAGHYFRHVDTHNIKYRSQDEYYADYFATQTNEESHGVKGESPFLFLSNFDMIFGE